MQDTGYSERLHHHRKEKYSSEKTQKREFKEMPSSGSRTAYKILNSLAAPRDSSYLQARLNYFNH